MLYKMRKCSTTEARKKLAAIVIAAAYKDERTLLTHYGKVLAAVVPVADLLKSGQMAKKSSVGKRSKSAPVRKLRAAKP
ncbi:MAG TPA: hypothetical protein VGF45_07800 [Polyangia bacterium]